METFVRADNTLVWLNLLYLMLGVAFMPVPAAVLGAWLGNPRNELVAALFYGGAAPSEGWPTTSSGDTGRTSPG